MTGRPSIMLRRVYEPPRPDAGRRILVDRIWPRGLSREAAAVDLWLKEVAPSTELRRDYGHDPARWQDFVRRYHRELADNPALELLRVEIAKGPVCLVYAAKDEHHNNAVALRTFLEGRD